MDKQSNNHVKYELQSDPPVPFTPVTIPKQNLQLSNIFNLQSPGNELKMLMSLSENMSKYSVVNSQVIYNPGKYKELINYSSIKQQFHYLQKCFTNDPTDQNVAASLLNFYILDSRLDIVDFKLFIASLLKSVGNTITPDLGFKILLSYAIIVNNLQQSIDTFEYICQIMKKGKTSFIVEAAEKVFQNLFNVNVLDQVHFQLTPQSPPKLFQLHLDQYKNFPPDKQLIIIKEIKHSLLPNFEYKSAKQNEKDLYVVYQMKKLQLLLELRQHAQLNQKANKLILLLANQQHKILYIKARNQIMQQLINNDYEFHQEAFDTIMAGYRCAPVKQSRNHLIHARKYLRLTKNEQLLSYFMTELDFKFEKKIQQQVFHASSPCIDNLEYFRKIAGTSLKNGDFFVDLTRYLILYQNMLQPAIQSLQIALNFTPQNGDIYFWWLVIKQIQYVTEQNNILSHEDDIFKRTFLRVQPEYGKYFSFIKEGIVKTKHLPTIYLIMEKIVCSEISMQSQLIQRLFTIDKPKLTVEDILQTGTDLTLSHSDSSLTSSGVQQISEIAFPRFVFKIEEQIGQDSDYDILGTDLYYSS